MNIGRCPKCRMCVIAEEIPTHECLEIEIWGWTESPQLYVSDEKGNWIPLTPELKQWLGNRLSPDFEHSNNTRRSNRTIIFCLIKERQLPLSVIDSPPHFHVTRRVFRESSIHFVTKVITSSSMSLCEAPTFCPANFTLLPQICA